MKVCILAAAVLLAVSCGLVDAGTAAASGWKVQSTPALPGAHRSHLYGVSCTAAKACMAVGDRRPKTGAAKTLAERWNGTKWSLQASPNPAGTKDPALLRVSCAGAQACMAVGSYTKTGNPSQLFPLAERWNGTAWALQPPTLAGVSSSLAGVSCTAGAACTAVGTFAATSTSDAATLVERWNGASWKTQSSPNRPGRSNSLNAIACTGPHACVAVGQHFTTTNAGRTLVERWNGTSWSIQPSPNPAGPNSGLGDVSCTAADACTAVGSAVTSGTGIRHFAERWNGTKWTIQTTPRPSGATRSFFNGVSCSGPKACTAVGFFEKPGVHRQTLVERWDGTKWTIQSSPNPAGKRGNELFDVSCTTAKKCTAVGDYGKPQGEFVPLVERHS